jgi:hypothetical protein
LRLQEEEVKAGSRAENIASLEELVDIELSETLSYLLVARNQRRAGHITAAIRQELSAQRAYQEARNLFRVLRHHICQAAARRLAVRIKKIDSAMQEG